MRDFLDKSSTGHKTGSSGASLVIVCFFMPWILVSCGAGQPMQFSGWDLAAGTTVNTGFGTEKLPGTPAIFIIIFAALAAIVLAYLAYQRGHITSLDRFGLIGLGSVPLITMFSQLSKLSEQATREGFLVENQFGLWGCVLGLILMLAGGVINMGSKSNSE